MTTLPVDAALFRALLRHQASTVTVVTAPGTPPAGFTATSFTSVSLQPLRIGEARAQRTGSLQLF
jgi:flavin reductase (DIM6/NTAB) family NADH-FMN oxidoreductase RutF